MNLLNNRLQVILFHFNEAINKTITSQDLANKVAVSARTIKKDIAELRSILLNYGARIESHAGLGYTLKISDSLLFNRLLVVQKTQYFNCCLEIPHYRYERVNYIIKKLLVIDYYIRLEYLADELYVSRSTIAGDMKEVRKILSDYDLKIITKPNYGIILDGGELNKRLCISEYYFHNDVSTGFFAADNAMFVSDSNQLELSIINDIMIQAIQEFKLNISDFALQNMVIHIIIAIRRWRFYNYVKIAPDKVEYYQNYREFPVACWILERLKDWLNIILPSDEAIYFTLHLHSKHVNELEDLRKDEIVKIEKTLFEIYSMFQNKFNFMVLDKNLFESYARLHIMMMVERLRTGMMIRNPQVYDVFSKYPLATYLTLFVKKIIETNFQIQININEFAYLVLYTNLLITNSCKSRMKILLVCYQGRPEMITLLNELNETMSKVIQNIEICDYYNLKSKNLNEYGLLITTVPINTNLNIPISYITDSIPYSMQIQRAIQGLMMKDIQITDILQEKYFLNGVKAGDRNDVLKEIANLFNGQAQEIYKNLWSGEQEICIETSNNIVLLHTSEPINENFFLFINLKKSIIWKYRWVQIVIWVNISDSDIQYLMKYFSLVVVLAKIENLSEKLLNINSFSELVTLFVELYQKGE